MLNLTPLNGAPTSARTSGRPRTSEGYLIEGDQYLLPEQERVRRWGRILMALGAVIFLAATVYVAFKYGAPRGLFGLPRARFASWAVMPGEVRLLLPAAIAGWALFFGAGVRLILLNHAVRDQLLSDLAASEAIPGSGAG